MFALHVQVHGLDHCGTAGAQFRMLCILTDVGMMEPATGALGVFVHGHGDSQAFHCFASHGVSGSGFGGDVHLGDDKELFQVSVLDGFIDGLCLFVQVQGDLGVGRLLADLCDTSLSSARFTTPRKAMMLAQ